MIILCDVDEVLLNLMPVWLGEYNKSFGDDLLPEAITDWDLSKFVLPECGQKIFEYIKSPYIFEKAGVVEGSISGIKKLKNAGHRVVYATINNPSNVKYRWLEEKGFLDNSKDLIVAEDKSLIMSDFMIDDNPENIENCYGVGILFDQPHNRKFKWSLRAKNWQEVVDIIEGCGGVS